MNHRLTSKQFRLAAIFAVLLSAAILAGIVGWVMLNAKATRWARMAEIPQVTVAVEAPPQPEQEVPPSWQPPTQQTPAAMPPEAETPPVTAPEPEKPVETPVEKPVEKQASEKPVAQTPPVTVDPVATPPALAKWQKYARPFDVQDKRPKIVLVIADLGLAAAATQAAIQELPGEVNLAFSSSSPSLEQWLELARIAGHETVLTVPMEPENYPQNDSGPNSLLLGLSDQENTDRLKRTMARADGYVAIAPYMGEKFVASEKKMIPVLQNVGEQQIMILDGTLNKNSLIAPLARYQHIPFARADLVLDAAAASGAIDQQLLVLEQLARDKGQALGIALPYPVTFEKLKTWIATLDKKGLVLAPLTVLAAGDVAPIEETKP